MQEVEGYMHSVERRSKSEIQLTTKLAKALTQLNLNTIQKIRENGQQNFFQKSNFFFVCFCGLPPYENQFENLDLPGEKVIIKYTGFDRKYSPQELQRLFWEASIQKQAQKVHELVQTVPRDKNIVFVLHSFGSFIAHTFMKIYSSAPIKGIIDLGAATLTMYPKLNETYQLTQNFDWQFVFENAEFLFEEQKKVVEKWNKKSNAGVVMYQTKQEFILSIRYMKDPVFKNVYQNVRNMPNVLKLFCSGGKDNIFTQDLLCQKAIFYSYKRELPSNYHQKLKKVYKEMYGKQVNNVQERFVFNFQGGAHSFHMQPRFIPTLKTIIKQYLMTLSQVI